MSSPSPTLEKQAPLPEIKVIPHALDRRRWLGSYWITVLPLLVGDAAAALAGCLAAEAWPAGLRPPQASIGALFSLPVFLACAGVSGLYPAPFLHPAEKWRRLFWSACAAAAMFGSSCYFRHMGALVSVVAGLVFCFATCFSAIALRTIVRRRLARFDWWGIRTVVIADGPFGVRLSRLLEGYRNRGLRVVGWHSSDASWSAASLGAAHSKRRSNHGSSADYAVIATPGIRVDELASIVSKYGRFRRVFLTWDMDGFSGFEAAGGINDLFALSVRQNLACFGPGLLKRFIDLAAGLALGVALSPLLTALWILVRLTSPGAGFYCQTRIGRAGRTFNVWKFRTMVAGADQALFDYLEEHPDLREEWALTQKLKNDPRNTPIGRFLRKASLDELPQLWNVLRGDMSLVGPRPIVDNETKNYGGDYAYYLQVRPGVTGLWQVSGRNNTSYPERVAFDRFYVRNWSVWLDIYILARTVKTVFTGHGAY
jgi:Undecaprenyl-phosphate galactose phosphotransferase WbaP